jgi:hypothetical protein
MPVSEELFADRSNCYYPNASLAVFEDNNKIRNMHIYSSKFDITYFDTVFYSQAITLDQAYELSCQLSDEAKFAEIRKLVLTGEYTKILG